ncbi:MAG TPA: serine hydrolase [Pyrinomonadaceae bacterium]|nr:serine hydrolase [Pyrinomonadaceae bacterium]
MTLDNLRTATLRTLSRATPALLFACLLVSNPAQARARQTQQQPQPTQPQTQQPQQPQAQDLSAKMDEYLNAAVKAEGFSGSVLVARRGQPVFARGYGMADYEGRVANTPRTKFRIGSLTKQFTAAAVLLLQERGRLSVEDPVCKHVEPCPAAWQPIKIHHLLSHTAGIPNFTSFPDYPQTMGQPSPPAQTITRFRDRPLEFQPGENHKYSNSGYVLLGLIIEKVSGQPYAAFMRENIFKPLKMENTGYDDPAAKIELRAKGYAGIDGAPKPAAHIDMTIPHAAGALYSTVEDLHLWEQSLSTEKILKRASLDAMFTEVRSGYAYGWNVGQQFNRKRHAHGGGINGFSAFIARYPEEGVAVVVLANNEAGPSSPGVARDLSAIVFGERYEVPVERKIVKVDPKIYDAYAGEYELGPGFVMTVTREGDGLFAQPTGQNKAELLPTSETTFFPRRVRAEVTFVKDAEGKVTHLVLNQGGRQQTAKKIK